jgi:hypothetical protein
VAGSKSTRKTRKRRIGPYSEGQRNKIIDAIAEPLAKEDDVFLLIDAALHFLNEGDPEESLIKFAKYTLPELLRRWLRKRPC